MSKITTETQVSAGGVIYRGEGSAAEVALIRLGERWQLPKGMIQAGEALEAAAAREVQEETGITGEIQTLIERVEYWYYAKGGKRRFHKFVYFYLLRATGGDTANHDKEADEARWVRADAAEQLLTFANEKAVMARAQQMLP